MRFPLKGIKLWYVKFERELLHIKMIMKEKAYITYRILKAKLSSLFFYTFRVFPIDKNLVSVCTFEGKGGFGCNPKYVVSKLHEMDPDIRFVWFLNKNAMSKEMPDYIKKVPNTLLSRAYWLTRSKVWIDNYRKPYGTVKRKEQYYLNTNHYTLAIKTVGLWRGKGFSRMAYLVSKNDSDMIDDLIIDSKFGEIICPKGLLFDGPYLKTGAPRCDILYGDRNAVRKDYRQKNNLPEDAKILLYAPTFREGAKDGKRFVYSADGELDFLRMIRAFQDRFGGEWYLCIRVHPQLAATYEDRDIPGLEKRILNESQADDMYEIMAASDAYVTDYSSACFEAGFAEIPVFIYAEDISRYEKDRGALFWNMATDSLDCVHTNQAILKGLDAVFPFSISTNNDELEEKILKYDAEIYGQRRASFHQKIDLVFDGHASKEVAKAIIDRMHS